MRNSRFLHIFIRASIVASITIGMLTVSISETSALSEATSDSENSGSSASVEEPVEAEIPENITEASTNTISDTTENPEITDNEESNSFEPSGTDVQDTETSQPADPSESTDDSFEGDSEPADSSEEISEPEDNDIVEAPSLPSESPENSSDQNTDPVVSGSSDSSSVSENIRPQENVPSSSESTLRDDQINTTRITSSFSPSRPFPDASEKIKYNVFLPIDNIPAFITQEMIIGALKCQDETGFPASVTIAQIIQESGYGYYGEGGENGQGLSYLAYQYCNLFGIKGKGPAGTVNMRTGEQTVFGENYTITAGFRIYNTYTECIEDRTKLLQNYYSDLTAGVTDANTFAIKIAGRWATSLTYGQNLIAQMKHYDLYRLDEMTLQEFSDMIGRFANPCPGAYLTSGFGYRTFDDSFHKGIDLGTNGYNLPTYAAEAGTVIKAEWDSTAGYWIVIDHGNGLITQYMHHKEIYVEEGQHVEKGQQIGLTGNTGNASGVHLHFQIEENGSAIDPVPYLSE